MSGSATITGGAGKRDPKLRLHPNWFYRLRQHLSEQVFGIAISQQNASALYGMNGQHWKRIEMADLSSPYETFRASAAVVAGYVPVTDFGPDKNAVAVRRKLADLTEKEVPIMPATVSASTVLESLAFTASDLNLPPIPIERVLIGPEEFDRIAAEMNGKRRPRLKIAA